MHFKKLGQKYILAINKEEEIVKILTDFAKAENTKLVTISAIGALNSAIIGYYELSTKSYHWKDFSGDLEVTSLLGNIALFKGEQFIHAHIDISNENLDVFGGHIKQAIVGGTLEVVIELVEGEIQRKFNDEIGLNLMDFYNESKNS